MLIAKVQNEQVVEVADYRDLFPNTSFAVSGPDSEFMEANSCLPVCVFKTYNSLTERLASVAPYIEDSQVFTIAVEPLTPEEIEANTQSQWAKVRSQRDTMLRDNVDTMNPMRWETLTTEQQQTWRDYRQALLDVTNQDDPYNIVWPMQPSSDLM